MRKNKVLKIIKSKGWKVVINNLDFRRQAPELWYEYTDIPILRIEKDGKYIELTVYGEIRIFGKRENTRFIYNFGKPDGELTYYLRRHGEWWNNNWFEIDENGSSYEYFEEPFFSLDDAVKELLRRL